MSQKRGIVLIEHGFQPAELLYPYYRLQEAGYTVHLVGPEADSTYEGEYGYKLKSDRAAKDVNIKDYNVLVVPGGRAPDRLRRNKNVVNLVNQAFDMDKTVAAICHGLQVLIDAEVLEGRTATCFYAISKDVENAGAIYKDQEVVVDENLITSRHPGDLPVFMRETLNALES